MAGREDGREYPVAVGLVQLALYALPFFDHCVVELSNSHATGTRFCLCTLNSPHCKQHVKRVFLKGKGEEPTRDIPTSATTTSGPTRKSKEFLQVKTREESIAVAIESEKPPC